MERIRRLLLDVWREACRHIEIQEAAVSIAAMLRQHLPLECLVIQRFEPSHHLVATVAVAPASSIANPLRGAHECAPPEMKKLLAWTRRSEIFLHAPAGKADAALAPLRYQDIARDLCGAPLVAESGPTGAALLIAQRDERFNSRHEAIVQALMEPLSVALENDRRLHEIASLREAAEADRQSLLHRLGRREMGDTIVGEQSGLRQVMQRVDLVSRSDAPVLILGETGTGKELVARAIHQRGPRHDGPFIRVNCGAIPADLIDSQLFGHEKGSFTGAADSRQGWFERADRGTLFLDEIGELPLDAQVRFLRVLQDGLVERVGSHEAIRVDVRVVAATNRDLAEMVRDRSFREDLWYRIAVFPILLPPLRERLDDIRELATHFAERAAVRFGLAAVVPSESDLALLRTYSWPGNIRELGAVIDRAAILGEGRSLEIAAAIGSTQHAAPQIKRGAAAGNLPAQRESIVTLDEAMRRHIETTLRATQGRIEGPRGAARLLAINPHTLRARMRKLGIDWQQFRLADP
jgi:transcriptional regulator with GAF, ATPase, and Fis domain